MKSIINDIERGSNFLQGFTERDLNSREDAGDIVAAESLEAYFSENDREYIVEIPAAELKEKELELGVGQDHLSVFLRQPGRRGLEYRTVLFAEEVNPVAAVTEQKEGLYRIIVPKAVHT